TVGQSFRCVCNPGFHGTLCDQEEIDVCFSAPCQNGGTCTRTASSFRCLCPESFEGPTCADRVGSCGSHISGTNGTVQFPETGTTYDHRMSCAWVITVPNSKVINITFDHFDLEDGGNCEFDFLQINDGPNAGSRMMGRFCGDVMHRRNFVSTHNHIYLWFQSDKTVAHSGFLLQWAAVDP
ncbi:cubilin, partial [Nephila pilipes]